MDLFDLPNKQDYIDAILHQENILIPNVSGLELSTEQYKEGAYCIIFPAMIGQEKSAIRCWKCIDDSTKEVLCRRMSLVSSKLKEFSNPYLVEFDFYEAGLVTAKGIFPVSVMKWCDDISLNEYIQAHIYNTEILQRFAFSFLEMTDYLHYNKISHGDFQPDNIRVKANGSLYLIDYDTLYLPCMQQEKDSIKGMLDYQHPGRQNNEFLSPFMDYFAEYVIYLSISIAIRYPDFWNETIISNKGSLFMKDDYLNIYDNKVFMFLKQQETLEFQNTMSYLISALKENDIAKIIPINKLICK